MLHPVAELLLFCAARADLVRRVIRPALETGRDVVCDRFSDSTVAYQGVARGLGAELAERVNDTATGGLRPALTLLLKADAGRALEAAFEVESSSAIVLAGRGAPQAPRTA